MAYNLFNPCVTRNQIKQCKNCEEDALPDRPYCHKCHKEQMKEANAKKRKLDTGMHKSKTQGDAAVQCRDCGKDALPDRPLCKDCHQKQISAIKARKTAEEDAQLEKMRALEQANECLGPDPYDPDIEDIDVYPSIDSDGNECTDADEAELLHGRLIIEEDVGPFTAVYMRLQGSGYRQADGTPLTPRTLRIDGFPIWRRFYWPLVVSFLRQKDAEGDEIYRKAQYDFLRLVKKLGIIHCDFDEFGKLKPPARAHPRVMEAGEHLKANLWLFCTAAEYDSERASAAAAISPGGSAAEQAAKRCKARLEMAPDF